MKKAYYILILFLAMPCILHAKAEPSSLIALSSAERSYYTQVFTYTMDHLDAGTKYEWKTHTGSGVIHVDELFTSKSRVPCRHYSETFKVHGKVGAYQGYACKRIGSDGWCRLKPSNAHTCAMEDPAFMFAMPSMKVPGVNIGAVGNPAEGMEFNAEMPDVNAPNFDFETPKIPDGKKASNGFADTVTGSAGQAAGKAASSGFGWFFKTFGR